MKVLVTAFEPFGKSSNNYSKEVINYINNVDKIILDVCYDKCYKDLCLSYSLEDYDLIISLGEARSRKTLTLELNAKNISSCSLADNNGVIKKEEKIINDDIENINTKVDVSKLSNTIEFSYDAGKFVCNNLYFHLLNNYPNKALFIHIPDCENDINKYIENAKTIEKIIDILKK